MKFKQSFCTERTSLEINVLKVICCIGVVCLHTSFTSIPVGKEDLVVNGGGYFQFVSLLQHVLKICVPTFFFLSGYLFFLNYNDYDIKWYVNKFRNRIKSLLVPYILSNIVVFLCFYISNFLFTSLMGSGKSYCMYDNILDYLLMFWSPLANPVLWFIRDLFIVILLSPLMMPLVKKSRGGTSSFINCTLVLFSLEIRL